MDSSELTISNLRFEPIKKDRLFFDRYQYNVCFRLKELTALRHRSKKLADARRVTQTLDRRASWSQRLVNAGGSWVSPYKVDFEITDKIRNDLLDFRAALEGFQDRFHLQMFGDWGYLYTNDTDMIRMLSGKSYLECKKYRIADVTRPRDTIALRDPQHRLRTYFKSILLTDQERDYVVNYLQNQSTAIRLSPALHEWILRGSTVLQSYFFLDHDDPSVLNMMDLVRPGLQRKTQTLIKA